MTNLFEESKHYSDESGWYRFEIINDVGVMPLSIWHNNNGNVKGIGLSFEAAKELKKFIKENFPE